MLDTIRKDAESRMNKTLHTLEEELTKLRAGRASPTLLEGIHIDYYGTPTPLVQVATIVAENAMSLSVKPWERNLIPVIEKAILTSGLGLNPSTQGDTIRVPLPPLSEERRKELIKKVKAAGEDAKVSIRNIRRDANNDAKVLLKDKEITEDDARRAEEAMQKLTDGFVKKIDQVLAKKEADLLEI